MPILGIDEVGRGPWAGPLVVGAVILPDVLPTWTADLTDSKKLTANQRETLNQLILSVAPATGLGWVSSAEIDQIGLRQALRLATRRAVKSVQALHVPFSEIIIDGNINFLADTKLAPRVSVLKKADLLIKEVSSASIIAKVARDRYMVELAKTYPGYGFETHVGYGTARHRAALENLGPCPEHRFSFRPVQSLCISSNAPRLNAEPVECATLGEYKSSSAGVRSAPRVTLAEGAYPTDNTTTKGRRAETIVADYLEAHGHRLIAKNYKTKLYEIDLISIKDDQIYFTEVKYRQSPSHGAPFDAITKSKLRQMHFSATAFLKTHPRFKSHQPLLAVSAVSGPTFHLDAWFPLDC